MKILVVGNGGREHALVWKIKQSPLVKAVFCAPGNAGIAALADCVPIETSSIVELADFAQQIKADLTVVGPELPMVLGLADEFQRRGLSVFCPSRAAAELEGSKAFSREFMQRHGIPGPRFEIAASLEAAQDFVKRSPFGYPLVVKVDGLAAGKGTVIVDDAAQARECVEQMMTDKKKFGQAGSKIVFEEFLPGEEVSFLVFSDGAKVVPMVSVQDHKRLLDGDKGPNTGGMGTVSPATNLSIELHKQVMQEVIVPTIAGMNAEGRRFQGVLYAGLMITEDGPKVLEYNVRFGDPEAQVILARMKSDLVPILAGVADGNLKETRIEWAKEPAVCVVIAARGYPDAPEIGREVSGLDGLDKDDLHVFHAATELKDGKVRTVGGRILGVTALAANLDGAIARAYEATAQVQLDGGIFRKDIGQRALARLHAPTRNPA